MARLMASGIMNWADVLVSKINGIKPSDVVAVVRKIGLKRRSVAFNTASSQVQLPSFMIRLYLSISISESLTTTPARATTPNSE